ncbi:MAG: hypothetical protein E7610_06450 [Ruminococcaceae bacterium]|nr:hypothetical protein [Oscillospiraceae bacterium]
MNKKLLVILTASLLLLSTTACSACRKPGKDPTTTAGNDESDTNDYIVVGTDEFGSVVTSTRPDPIEPGTDAFDPTEENPTFTDVTMKVIVVSAVATVRTSTRVEENNGVGWPSEGRILDATGESANWYRVSYDVNGEEQTCYIAKTVAADASVLDAFTAIENGEEVEVTVDAVNVRSYPSTATTHSIRGSLKLGDKVTRIAVSENWSRILYTMTSETETDADGNPVVKTQQYYISNDCLKVVETVTTEAATTEAAQ